MTRRDSLLVDVACWLAIAAACGVVWVLDAVEKARAPKPIRVRR